MKNDRSTPRTTLDPSPEDIFGRTGREPLDVLGIGFGPSNLALALAVEEHNRSCPPEAELNAAFIERQPAFGWHRGMLIDDATMQVSFLKDLVTMRNPTSRYSFLCYLRDRERLVDFINHKTMFPLRTEFHDYLEWAAAQVPHQVRYGLEAIDVRPVISPDGIVEEIEVLVRPTGGGGTQTFRTRNLVLAAGLTPKLPDGMASSVKVWHTSELMHRLPALRERDPHHVVVLGAGQSGAEAVAELHTALPDTRVSAVFARYGYSPADDSPFANRIFDPAAVDDFHTASAQVREMLLDYHRGTNYSVVDLDLIEELYRREYREKVAGRRRLDIRSASRIRRLVETDDVVLVDVEHLPTGAVESWRCDGVVLATGYRPADVLGMLGQVAAYCETDDSGLPLLERDYRIRTGAEVTAGLYVQGATEHSHGLTSTLLSNTAVRAGEILDSLRAPRPAGARRLAAI